ncbi:hypothetical protein [Mesorhizobium sp. M0909]|uniref:hypothetical protein n=1 Tax=Mesorhizobium sp. M0909 TaxID=2957024 RepID=UPI003338CA50
MIEALERDGISEIEGNLLRLTKAGVSEVERYLLLDVDPIGPVLIANGITLATIFSAQSALGCGKMELKQQDSV